MQKEYILEFSDSSRAMTRHLSLGELLDEVAKAPDDAPVLIDLGGGAVVTPTYAHSYRGVYAHVSFDYEYVPAQRQPVTVAEFRKEIDGAIGATFEGWKGGDFTMDRGTRVWISPEGIAGNEFPTHTEVRTASDGTVFLAVYTQEDHGTW